MNTMKNICLLILSIISITLSQDLQIKWSKTYNDTHGNNIDLAHDGGFVLNLGAQGIVKVNNQGIIQDDWPQDPAQYHYGYIQKCDEGYITIGNTRLEETSKLTAILKKLDNQGNLIWEKYYYKEDRGDVDVWNSGDFVKQTQDKGYILFCTSDNNADPSGDRTSFWFIKTDPYGEIEWEEGASGDYYGENTTKAVHQLSDDGYLFVYNNDYGGLTRLSPDGQEIWEKSYEKIIQYALPTDDDGFLVCGNSYSASNLAHYTAYLTKLDENGDKIWEKTFQNVSKDSYLTSITKLDNNNYMLCGRNIDASDWRLSEGWLIKTDSFGNKIWEKTFPEINNIKQILVVSENEYLLFGDKDSDVTLIKIKEYTQQGSTRLDLLDPVNNKLGVGTQLCLDWTSFENASSYLIEIDDNSDMIDPVISETVSNNSNYIIKGLSYATQYYWRVRANLPDGSNHWSNTSSFKTMPPPSIELNGTDGYCSSYVDVGDQYYTDREYIITELPEPLKNCLWIKTKNSDKYLTDDDYIQFQLKRDATIYIAYDNRASAVPHWLSSGFEQTQYTIVTSDEYCNLNVWKGQFAAGDVTLGANLATGAEGVLTNFSVLIDIPLQTLDPRNNKAGIGIDLAFSWEPLGNFGNYDLQISDNQDMSSPLYNIADIINPRYYLNELDYDKDYYWRVKAHNRSDDNAWSQKQKFHTMTEPPVDISHYSNNVLSWLEENDQYYMDQNHVVLSIPDPLKNSLWIKTENNNSQNNYDHFISISLDTRATIYVGFDSRATSLPNWLTDDYVNTGLTIKVSDEAEELNIWSRYIATGYVSLGSNMAAGAENIKSQYVVLIDFKEVSLISANFGSDVTSGFLPLTVNFADSSQGLIPITSWLWNFGDGVTSTEQNPSHTYEKTGSYAVSLTVSGADTFDTKSIGNYITVYETIPVAIFGADKTSGDLPLTVNFSDRSHGHIESWLWNFGDGTTSTDQSPSHTYENVGSYSVSLTVSGPDGSDTMLKENYISVKDPAPTANFGADVIWGKVPLTVSFADSSQGKIDSWLWYFGDGLTTTSQNPTHVYTTADTFTVSLTVRGPGGSHTMIRSNYIVVDHPTSINDMAGIPENFALLPNYPNPFNPQTTIRFAVPKKSFVKITIYDVNGKQVNNLFSGIKSPGNHAITWNASGSPSGMYFIKMDTDTFSSIRKCMLVK